MKVCTDACILGAWIADKIGTGQINASTIFSDSTLEAPQAAENLKTTLQNL